MDVEEAGDLAAEQQAEQHAAEQEAIALHQQELAAVDAYAEDIHHVLAELMSDESFNGNNIYGIQQETVFMVAVKVSSVETLTVLLDRGANVNAADVNGMTSLYIAIAYKRPVEILALLVAHGADVHQRVSNNATPLIVAAGLDNMPACEFLISKGADLTATSTSGGTALTKYGVMVQPHLSPETLALRRDHLEALWRAGPHPSQVQRRKDEAWDRRKSIMQVSAENGYRPLAHRVAAMPPVDPAAAIPDIEIDTPAKRHAHLLGQVLSNEGVHRNIVGML